MNPTDDQNQGGVGNPVPGTVDPNAGVPAADPTAPAGETPVAPPAEGPAPLGDQPTSEPTVPQPEQPAAPQPGVTGGDTTGTGEEQGGDNNPSPV